MVVDYVWVALDHLLASICAAVEVMVLELDHSGQVVLYKGVLLSTVCIRLGCQIGLLQFLLELGLVLQLDWLVLELAVYSRLEEVQQQLGMLAG